MIGYLLVLLMCSFASSNELGSLGGEDFIAGWLVVCLPLTYKSQVRINNHKKESNNEINAMLNK